MENNEEFVIILSGRFAIPHDEREEPECPYCEDGETIKSYNMDTGTLDTIDCPVCIDNN